MFMPEGGVVMEMMPTLNDATMPLCGYYGNMAYGFGHHHYLYAYDYDNGDGAKEDLRPDDLVKELKIYYDFIHSDESKELRKPAFVSSKLASFIERIDLD